MDAESTLIEDIASYYDDPLGWVMYNFDWEGDESIKLAKLSDEYKERFGCEYGPDEWACQILDEWGQHIKEQGFDGKLPVKSFQCAVASGHGIGKSTLSAWIILFILSTRPHAKGIVTANTSDQLKTKTWAELGKWLKKSLVHEWFIYNNGRGNMNICHKDFRESWRCDGQTSREENSESFAGLHAANSTPFYIFDEASAVPDIIWEVAEGGLTDGEPFWFAFGNPTRNSGRFKDCFQRFKARWVRRHIDSRDVQITNKAKLAEWLEDYGEDSDFAKVRIKGIFPQLSFRQFISTAVVDAAYGKPLRKEQIDFAPVILSCDPAWEGDDKVVIGKRQGLLFEILYEAPKNDNDMYVGNLLAQYETEHKADAVFVDLGYGTGIISYGRTIGRDWQLIGFGEKALKRGFKNKREEMYNELRTWLIEGGALPEDMDLYHELTNIEAIPRTDGIIQLESKKDMKARSLPSPDKADALALTFAAPVVSKKYANDYYSHLHENSFNPLERRG